jgi:hypothetical protein
MIGSRGKPNSNDVVHYFAEKLIRPDQRGCHRDEHDAVCRNGSYHILATTDKGQVTCPACLKLLSEGVTKIDLRNC